MCFVLLIELECLKCARFCRIQPYSGSSIFHVKSHAHILSREVTFLLCVMYRLRCYFVVAAAVQVAALQNHMPPTERGRREMPRPPTEQQGRRELLGMMGIVMSTAPSVVRSIDLDDLEEGAAAVGKAQLGR